MITLPYPPSLNTYWRNVKGRTLISAKGRAYRGEAIYKARLAQRFGSAKVCVSIKAWVPDARRRDLDNLFKAALDALAYAKVYEDDSQIMRLSIENCGIDRSNPRLEIMVEAL